MTLLSSIVLRVSLSRISVIGVGLSFTVIFSGSRGGGSSGSGSRGRSGSRGSRGCRSTRGLRCLSLSLQSSLSLFRSITGSLTVCIRITSGGFGLRCSLFGSYGGGTSGIGETGCFRLVFGGFSCSWIGSGFGGSFRLCTGSVRITSGLLLLFSGLLLVYCGLYKTKPFNQNCSSIQLPLFSSYLASSHSITSCLSRSFGITRGLANRISITCSFLCRLLGSFLFRSKCTRSSGGRSSGGWSRIGKVNTEIGGCEVVEAGKVRKIRCDGLIVNIYLNV